MAGLSAAAEVEEKAAEKYGNWSKKQQQGTFNLFLLFKLLFHGIVLLYSICC